MLVNWFKNVANKFDKVWVNSAGWPIEVIGFLIRKNYVEDTVSMVQLEKPITIYGFYTLPETKSCVHFGIDFTDEMNIEVNPTAVQKVLGKSLKVGTILKIEDKHWKLINISYKHHWFYGKRRLTLTCRMYHESVTTANGHPAKTKNRV